MVGARLMVTAQHCLDRRRDGSVGWMKFTPAYYDGQAPYGSANAEKFRYYHKNPHRASGRLYESEFAWDHVVVKLNWHIGKKTGSWGARIYHPSWNGKSYWKHIGYGGDKLRGQRPLFHNIAPIHSAVAYTKGGRKSMLLKHTIDSAGGQSGGPVFGHWKGGG
eukprot:CAMPEP_0201601654 /NCGR_PEP_ID=MMETSP0492-20130828/2583_1 /ASSEMBLY_ACC=CAM_ASM_000837 /TAXON_ID=420259 /ORGANISM="Thalassiosira gravida, Strain GMp14c1" /LENGTH=162 /DNA_ID=CAMNT_0048064955 /DNA_START=104 /DNA_END=592 /DNA_ORIENTATION=+